MKYNLIAIKKDNHRSLYNVSLHKHNHFEIVFYIKGHGEVFIDEKEYKFSPNTFSFSKPGVSHKEFSNDIVSLIYIGFSLPLGEAINIKNGLYKCPKKVNILNLLNNIRAEHEQKGFYSDEIINSLIESLVILVRRAIKMNKDNSKELNEIKKYIYSNIQNNINGKVVAKAFNYNYDYFRKMFKDNLRISINEFISKAKVDLGVKLLKKTNLSIEEVAKKSGFCSTSHFISLFKKYNKITPKQFLLNYDKNAEIK